MPAYVFILAAFVIFIGLAAFFVNILLEPDHRCKCSTHKTQAKLDLIVSQLETTMATLDELLASVEAHSTVDDSIIALLEGIAAQLKDALDGTVLPPVVQAKVDAVFAAIEADTKKVTDAITANTPAAPVPPPV